MSSAVATGHHRTSKAAVDILNAGGNSIDAAVGAYAMACVAEPAMASMAAGGFAMIYYEGDAYCLDFFCQTPQTKIPNARLDPIPVDFGTAQEQYYSGIGSVAVPGTISGLSSMHERFGRMPWKELFYPAIEASKSGLALTPFQNLDLKLLQSVFLKEKRGREIFGQTENDAIVKEIDALIQLSNHADFLEHLALEGADLFYKGEISQTIHKLSEDLGGHIQRSDLERYTSRWISPRQITLGRKSILVPSAPSMGGALLEEFLLEEKNQSSQLDDLYCRGKRFRRLLTDQKRLFTAAGLPWTGQKKYSGTSHLNVLDSAGNGVAMTFSIGEGSGIFLEGSDIHLNNMLGEPSLLPNGLDSWYPDTRLASMMTPTLVFEDDHLKYLLGTGGAERIASILGQTLLRLEGGMNLHDAINAPRTYLSGSNFEIEPGDWEGEKQNDYRFWEENSMYFGGVHGIEIGERIGSIGDSRREGHAAIL